MRLTYRPIGGAKPARLAFGNNQADLEQRTQTVWKVLESVLPNEPFQVAVGQVHITVSNVNLDQKQVARIQKALEQELGGADKFKLKHLPQRTVAL